MAKRAARETPVTPVTGSRDSVYADWRVAGTEEPAKAQLAGRLRQTIRRRRLTQMQAARLMGLDQPKVSALMSGRVAGFSSDRLMRFLAALGQDVEIVVKARPHGRERGHIRVVEAT